MLNGIKLAVFPIQPKYNVVVVFWTVTMESQAIPTAAMSKNSTASWWYKSGGITTLADRIYWANCGVSSAQSSTGQDLQILCDGTSGSINKRLLLRHH